MTNQTRLRHIAEGREVLVEAETQSDVDGRPVTWIRVQDAVTGHYLGENIVPGFCGEKALSAVADSIEEQVRSASSDVGDDATVAVSHSGRALLVTTILGIDDCGNPYTALTVVDAESGATLADETRGSWVTNDRIGSVLHFVLNAGPAPTLATDDFQWAEVVLHGNGDIASDGCEPTVTGDAEAAYEFDETRVTKIRVRANCSEWQQEQIADVLRTYWDAMRRVMPVGEDRICLHDSAFAAIHDGHCTLVAWDAFAHALQIEVGAMLAEPQPGSGT